MKSMSIAILESTRRLICSNSFRRTFILGDFKPQNLNFKDENKMEIQTDLNQVKLSFMLHDMAIFINEAMFQMFETNSYDKSIIDFLIISFKKKIRLENVELNFLYHLVLMEFIFKLLFSSTCMDELSIENNLKELFLNKSFLIL
jgi:Ser/Thr protein kinase RdoA (MazF antagonist)